MICGQIKDGIVSVLAGIPKLGGFQDGSFDICQFNSPTQLVFDYDMNLLVSDANGIRKIDLLNKSVTTPDEFKKYPVIFMATDSNLNLYIATEKKLIKFTNSWRLERWLWLAYIKEDREYCHAARLPNDVVKEISKYLIS